VAVVRPRLPDPTGLRRDDPAFLGRELPDDLEAEAGAGGGFWFGGSYYHSEAQVLDGAREHGVRSLRLGFSDVAFLRDLPGLQHLWLHSDGWTDVTPVADLTGLRALLLDVRSVRGELDPFALEDLRWFKAGLGGKGGAMLRPALDRGHPRLRFLGVRETTARTVAELVAGFPALEEVRVHYADRLRSLGDLAPVAATLRRMTLDMTQLRSLEGIEVLEHLEELVIRAGPLTDLTPLERLPALTSTDLTLAALRG
jgi:hypothetical protein